MARSRGVGKSIALLFLILAIILGGLLWFDYLGIIKAKSIFAPVYKLFGLQPQTSVSATSSKPLQANLEDDRLAKRLEALEIRSQELDKRESDIARSENANEAIARELSSPFGLPDAVEGKLEAVREEYERSMEANARYLLHRDVLRVLGNIKRESLRKGRKQS